MNRNDLSLASLSRRDFIRWGGKLAGGSALAAAAIPRVHAAEDNTIRLALVATAAAGRERWPTRWTVPNGNAKLVAMADLFPERLAASLRTCPEFGPAVDVPADRQFTGFDATARRSTACAPATWPC